jgi:hypothetical protein
MNTCLQSPADDTDFQIAISSWHLICDAFVSYTPTTPLPASSTSLSGYYNDAYCTSTVTPELSVPAEVVEFGLYL